MRTLEQVLEAHPLPLYKPDGSPSELNPMQKEDIVKLATMGRALGDLPVGYGKTPIATVVSLMLDPPAAIILVPPILIPQWCKWLRAIPGAGRVVQYEGTPAQRRDLQLRGARWIVCSYQIFKNDITRITKETVQPMTIVDEAQALKNYKSKLFKAVRDFSDGLPLLLMSGTIMSKPGDAYAYIKLNNPKVYPTYVQFENIHVEERDFFDNPKKWRLLDQIQANLDLSRVKRTKEEVHAHLPKVNYIPIEYELDKEHMKLYRQLMDEQLIEVGEGKIDATTAGKLYACSQQIIANWGHFADDETKRPALHDLLDEVATEIGLGEPVIEGDKPRSKLIIWTIFKLTSRSIVEYMTKMGQHTFTSGKRKGETVQLWSTAAAYGDVNSAKGVQKFLEDPDCRVLVAQYGSAGVGLNPQHLCWESLLVETPTTTIPFVQAVGRLDREGQVYNPNIRIAVAAGTVQVGLQKNLFANDKLVQEASGTKHSIKDLIFPK